jgi:hypothetical protein
MMTCVALGFAVAAAVLSLLAVIGFAMSASLAARAIEGRCVRAWKVCCVWKTALVFAIVAAVVCLAAALDAAFCWLSTPIGQLLGAGLAMGVLGAAVWEAGFHAASVYWGCIVETLDAALPATGERRERFYSLKPQLLDGKQHAVEKVLAAEPPKVIMVPASNSETGPCR